MAGTYLGYPFDAEIFFQSWQEEPDPVLTEILKCGAMVDDQLIASQMAHDGNIYTIPFYNTLTGDPVNYDGKTDIKTVETSGDSQTGVVYGRAQGWRARNFVAELSGSDPMGHIVSSVARFWAKYRQKLMVDLLGGIFGITGDTDWAKHTVTPGGKVEETTLDNAATEVLGDNSGIISMAIMHSHVAQTLKNLQVLEFWKYTDSNGIQRSMNLASINGKTVVIDDGVPYTASDGTNPAQYTTYLLGSGVLRFAKGRLTVPVETERSAAKNGGEDYLYTRIRETIHPNGFSYQIPASGWNESPTPAQLTASARWKRKFDHKAIAMVKVVTEG